MSRDVDDAVIVAAVEAAVGPHPVLLCGSRGAGHAREDSDYDLVVVLPLRRVLGAIGRLAAVSRDLEQRLGVPVSVKPVPKRMLETPERRLFLWKAAHEARVLAAPGGFEMPRPAALYVTPEMRFSYMVSALIYLVGELDPDDLREGHVSAPVARGIEKALLHLGQLRLMERGDYASTLDEVDDPELSKLGGRGSDPATWFDTRGLVVRALTPLPRSSSMARGLARNAQYAAVATLRGSPRLRPALSPRPIDWRIARGAIPLARAVRDGDGPDPALVAEAVELLPRALRPAGGGWGAVRDTIVREFEHAHPLLGI